MSSSPFIYGKTVSKVAFTNREDEAEKLFNNLTQGINTTIISPRRWGKSSLVEKVVIDINRKSKNHKTVVIDLFMVGTEEEFLELFAREVIKASSNKWNDWLTYGKEFFKQLTPKLRVGVNPSVDFTIEFNWAELKQFKDEVLNLPERIAEVQGCKFIICLDEFQNLSNYPDYELLEKRMRAIWQRQKSVTYCLYGSKRHMMTDIFNNPGKPFYRFGDIIILQKIAEERWVEFIVRQFKATKKKISVENARLIAQLMKNHSWYVQQLAHYTWQKTKTAADSDIIQQSLNELIYANSPLYQKEVETISGTQLNLLKAIVSGEYQLTSTKVMQTYRLGTPRNVSKNKTILINNDLVHELDKGYEFLDPAFERWFRFHYLGEKYDDIDMFK